MSTVGPPKDPIFLDEKSQVHSHLDYKLHEGRDCTYLIHSSVFSTEHDAYYIVGAQ